MLRHAASRFPSCSSSRVHASSNAPLHGHARTGPTGRRWCTSTWAATVPACRDASRYDSRVSTQTSDANERSLSLRRFKPSSAFHQHPLFMHFPSLFSIVLCSFNITYCIHFHSGLWWSSVLPLIMTNNNHLDGRKTACVAFSLLLTCWMLASC